MARIQQRELKTKEKEVQRRENDRILAAMGEIDHTISLSKRISEMSSRKNGKFLRMRVDRFITGRQGAWDKGLSEEGAKKAMARLVKESAGVLEFQDVPDGETTRRYLALKTSEFEIDDLVKRLQAEREELRKKHPRAELLRW